MWNMYVRIIKSQLNDVHYNGKFSDNANSIVYVLLFYSTSPCGYHTNPKLAILQDFAVAFADWPFPANNYLFKISD